MGVKVIADTHGFWLDFCYKVGDLVGKPLKKREVERAMLYYTRGMSEEDCAADIKRLRREDML